MTRSSLSTILALVTLSRSERPIDLAAQALRFVDRLLSILALSPVSEQEHSIEKGGGMSVHPHHETPVYLDYSQPLVERLRVVQIYRSRPAARR